MFASSYRLVYAAFSSALLATGCASWLPAPVPIRTVATRAHPDKQARCLLVLLPGRGDSAEDFAQHGFIQAIRDRKLDVDTISAHATLGYYARYTLAERLDADVYAPARAKGYEQIWFGGVSMGGLGSLVMAQRHGLELAGVILIAPYLGDNDIIHEITNAGGLAQWKPPASIAKDDYQHALWKWLKDATAKPETAPPMYLAAGDQDRLTMGHHLLGAVLPPERRFRIRGGHDWGPWRKLWDDFLDHSDFTTRCGVRHN